jgi:hypothetical protein
VKRFIIDYLHFGTPYSVYVEAKSWNDAEHRLAAIVRSGEVVGELVAEVPAPGFVARAMVGRTE